MFAKKLTYFFRTVVKCWLPRPTHTHIVWFFPLGRCSFYGSCRTVETRYFDQPTFTWCGPSYQISVLPTGHAELSTPGILTNPRSQRVVLPTGLVFFLLVKQNCLDQIFWPTHVHIVWFILLGCCSSYGSCRTAKTRNFDQPTFTSCGSSYWVAVLPTGYAEPSRPGILTNPRSHRVVLPTGSLFFLRVMQNLRDQVFWPTHVHIMWFFLTGRCSSCGPCRTFKTRYFDQPTFTSWGPSHGVAVLPKSHVDPLRPGILTNPHSPHSHHEVLSTRSHFFLLVLPKRCSQIFLSNQILKPAFRARRKKIKFVDRYRVIRISPLICLCSKGCILAYWR